MDLFDIQNVSYVGKTEQERNKAAIVTQSAWRMYREFKFYRQTLSIRQREKKRIFSEIEETNKFVNATIKFDRHEFIKQSKRIIYHNFPGISLENERFYGKKSNESITIKAKVDNIGRSCPLSLRQHSKNSVYFVLNTNNRSVSVKCFKCEGSKELSLESTLLNDIRPNLVISEKETKKTKTTNKRLENLDDIRIVKFAHDVLEVDNEGILEFYNLNHFVQIPARLDRKSPIGQNWNTRTFATNENINFKYNNIAILCGPESGIFVVDVDVNDNGLQYFQQLCTKNGYRYDLETTCVLTPSGGIHLYFKFNDRFRCNSVRMRSSDDKPIGIDIRSQGGCVIAPPSSYPKGKYQFLCMKRPQEIPEFMYDLAV